MADPLADFKQGARATWAAGAWDEVANLIAAVGGMFKTVGAHMPRPPDFAESPLLWGTEEHARELLEPHGLELEFERETVAIEHESVEELVAFYEQKFGPIVMAKAALGPRWPELRRDLFENFSSWNRAEEGSARIDAEYLMTIGRKAR